MAAVSEEKTSPHCNLGCGMLFEYGNVRITFLTETLQFGRLFARASTSSEGKKRKEG